MSKPSVFVVDDDEVVRLNIAKKLSRLHCTVRAFESGEALMEFLRDHRDEPDVILVDYKMGGMNGVETLHAIRKISSIPAIIFTAYEGWIDPQEMKEIGNCEVMIKTVDLHNLSHMVNGVMALRNFRKIDCWVDTGGLAT